MEEAAIALVIKCDVYFMEIKQQNEMSPAFCAWIQYVSTNVHYANILNICTQYI